jgi:hypothetical protein
MNKRVGIGWGFTPAMRFPPATAGPASTEPAPEGFEDLSCPERPRHVRFSWPQPWRAVPGIVGAAYLMSTPFLRWNEIPLPGTVPFALFGILLFYSSLKRLLPAHLWLDGPELVSAFFIGPLQIQHRYQFGGFEWAAAHSILLYDRHGRVNKMPGLQMRLRGGDIVTLCVRRRMPEVKWLGEHLQSGFRAYYANAR